LNVYFRSTAAIYPKKLKMKNLRILLLATFATVMFFSIPSCKKDDPTTDITNPNPTDTTGNNNGNNNPVSDSTLMHFSASVDGVAFSADTLGIVYTFDSALNLHVFTAPDNTGHIVTLMLNTLDEGTYDVDFDNSVIYQTGTTVYTGAFNPQGQIVISKNENNKISGTFNAELFDFNTAGEVSVTNGHFNNLPFN
jgi:hypothetical protein